MDYIGTTLANLLQQTAFCNLTIGNFIMIGVAFVFLYLAIRKGFEPLLLVPIAFGTMIYYMILCVKNSAAAISATEGITGQISFFVRTVFQNKELWITVIAFTICIFTVYVVRRLSIDHAWKVAVAAGAVANIVVIVIGDIVFDIHTS